MALYFGRLFALLVCAAPLLAGGCQFAAPGQNAEGVKMFQQAYYQGALQQFQNAIASDPHNPDGYYNVAATYHQIGRQHMQEADWQQAEAYKLLETWVMNSPTSATARIELARLYDESGQLDKAKDLLVEAVQSEPNNAKALAALGKVREQLGDTAQAMANYERSLSLNQYQPQLAQRVASIRASVAPPPATPPGGTRVVTTPDGRIR